MIDSYSLHEKLMVILPPGVLVHMTKPRGFIGKMKIVFCDVDMKVKFFEKSYELYPVNSDSTAMILQDAKDFTEIWNSPLAKVMREHE